MGKLTGKVAVVTGASKGIGAGIAKGLAAAGAKVVVNYASSKADAEKVVAEITEAGGTAIAVGGSVAKSAEINTLFAETEKAFGKVDILVNNAGVYGFAPLEEITEESFDWMFGINVKGLLLATQAAAKLFPPEGASIINIGSNVTSVTPPGSSVYAGTKAALDTITRVLAKELGPKNVRINAVNPGPVTTEGVQRLGFGDSDLFKQFAAQTPLGRIGQPDDIADVVTFLASDEARWMTGALVEAAGGLR